MERMSKLRRDELENMVDILSTILLTFVDAQTAEMFLRSEGFEREHLEAIGFDCTEE